MKLMYRDDNCAILDEVLEEGLFKQFRHYFNSLDFAYRSLTGWKKVWRISDGQVLAGVPYYASKGPHNCFMDGIISIVGTLATDHLSSIVGKKGEDWDDYFLTPYIYPAGTKISWHNDHGWTAAAILYTHRFWDPNWGGELFIAKTDPESELSIQPEDSDCVERVYLPGLLNKYGFGQYIAPLPNRIVFTKGKVWHCINRVDPVAGDALRSSVVAFFYKKKD
jgi:hypothetical protein